MDDLLDEGAALRRARAMKGLTQQALADKMTAAGHRWHQATIYKIENGDRKLSLQEGMQVCQVLGIDPSELVSRPIKPLETDLSEADVRRATEKLGQAVMAAGMQAAREIRQALEVGERR